MPLLTFGQTTESSPSLSTLTEACHAAEVDAELLHHSIEKQADGYYITAHRLVRYTRWIGALSLVSAVAACAPLYYLYAQVYRVWRIRSPRQVRQYQLACFGGAGLSLTSFLFLISPIGFLHVHDRRWEQAHELDALAVQALTLRQDYRTLGYWCDVLQGRRGPLTRHTNADVNASLREDNLPWVRVSHLVPVDHRLGAAEEVEKTHDAQPPSATDAPLSKEDALASALFKSVESADPATETSAAAASTTTTTTTLHAWTLQGLQRGKKVHGTGWVEQEMWRAMDACVMANAALIEARDATVHQSL